jgi:pimeloyl-ACP methyl ester carboxylesterase
MTPPHRAEASANRKSLAAALLAAAVLGTTAVLVRARAHLAERRHPPIGRFVTVDGVRLHYCERGHGSAIVLLHGNGATLDELLSSGLVERLARQHRVIVFDRPGFGYSERPRLRLWTPTAQALLIRDGLARLGVHEALVYGHSLGAQVAASLALTAPDLVRGLVLASGYFYPTARADVPLATPPAIPLIGDLLRYTLVPPLARLLLPRIYAKIFGPSPVPARFRREFPHELALRPWQLRAAAADTAFLIPTAAAIHERYASLRMPLTLITGDSDQLVDPARHSHRLHEEIPGSRLVTIPGAGHMVHHADPATVADAIEKLAADVFSAPMEQSADGPRPRVAEHQDRGHSLTGTAA